MHPSASSYDGAAMSHYDAQTYMARYESMRNSVQGQRNRKVFVVHKELERQCRNALRSQEFTSRMNDAELKRQRDRVQERLERIQSEQSRCKKENARRQAELDSEAKAHAERRRTLEEQDVATRQQKTDIGQANEQQIMERIGRMSMPNSVKQRLQLHYVAPAFASVYTAEPLVAVEGEEGQAGDGEGDARLEVEDVAADVVGLLEKQETPAL